MRFSQMLIPTLREAPADAEVVSHQLMMRAGMIRKVAAGVYSYLPLGLKVLDKISNIVRDEMNRAGAQEILMPAVCPAELWIESGRWEQYGKELLRIKDRHERDFCFGPTHEEIVTDIARREIRSYRELPMNLYQIQVKFRDELRPRFGLMRGREFIMKDAYSFHIDAEDCLREYQNMADAYRRIFTRCGLDTRQVESDTGAIGGRRAHEFQVLADSGEDAIVSCSHCDYAANVEKAEIGSRGIAKGGESTSLKKVRTPDKKTVGEVAAFLSEAEEKFIKTLLCVTSTGETVAALVRGDHELSEIKLRTLLGVPWITMAEAPEVERVTGAAVGFAGPLGLKVRIVADQALRGIRGAVAGANETDHHVVGIDQERDLPNLELADLRLARAGDACPRCNEGSFGGHRGIEVGNIFYLGTKYSAPMKATYLDASGQEHPMEMGCYGIGVTRTAAAAVEQYHDNDGIIWPIPIAPAHAQIVPVKWGDATLRETAESISADLQQAGVEILLDDRDERPGIKFKDADLIGLPFRITIGPKSLERGCVELKRRNEKEAREVPKGDVVALVASAVKAGLQQ